MARSIQVVIYMNQDLLDRIDRAAEETHDNRSEWIRAAIESKLGKEINQKTDR